MTVIAWDGHNLVADRQLSTDGMIQSATKIWRLKDGSLVGAAGVFSNAVAFVKWLDAGADPEAYKDDWDTEEGGFTIIRITKDREILIYVSQVPFTIEDDFAAIGSGAPYAIGALAAGLNSIRAVEIAMEYSADCGRGTNILTLDI